MEVDSQYGVVGGWGGGSGLLVWGGGELGREVDSWYGVVGSGEVDSQDGWWGVGRGWTLRR